MTAANFLTDRLLDDTDRGPIDPFALFEEWFLLAREKEPNDPHAMAVASLDEHGLPDVRIVLMNARDERGFVFFTNFNSNKGRQLLANPAVAMVMHWKSLRRQVRARGRVEVVAPAEADAYFASRSHGSQIASSVSDQSHPLSSRTELMQRFTALEAEIGDGPVPRPPHWSGFRIVPQSLEFWLDGAYRLHDRFVFSPEGIGWTYQRLNP